MEVGKKILHKSTKGQKKGTRRKVAILCNSTIIVKEAYKFEEINGNNLWTKEIEK